jgi:hypothetical protein
MVNNSLNPDTECQNNSNILNLNQLYKCYFQYIIPFMVERKWGGKENERSNYNLYSAQQPLIQSDYDIEEQPEDYLKENVLNVFSTNMIDKIKKWNTDTNKLESIDKLYVVNNELKKYQKGTLQRINDKLKRLHNKKHRNILNDQSIDYNYHKGEYLIELIMNTLFVLTLILTIHIIGISNSNFFNIGLIINIFIGLFFFLYFYAYIYSMQNRRYSNWNKKRFLSINENDNI